MERFPLERFLRELSAILSEKHGAEIAVRAEEKERAYERGNEENPTREATGAA